MSANTLIRHARMTRTMFLACLLLVGAFSCVTASAAGMFSSGRTHFAIYGGNGYAFDDEYFVIGANVSYYIADSLALGLAAETWQGGEPGIHKLTPSVLLVLAPSASIRPYLGGFYRRTYIENFPDLDSTGGRLGLMLNSGRNAYLGVGAVYEKYLDCDEAVYRRCDDVYPEFSLVFVFN